MVVGHRGPLPGGERSARADVLRGRAERAPQVRVARRLAPDLQLLARDEVEQDHAADLAPVALLVGARAAQPGDQERAPVVVGLLAVEEREADLARARDLAQRARELEHRRRARRAVVGADESGHVLGVVVRGDEDRRPAARQPAGHVVQAGMTGHGLAPAVRQRVAQADGERLQRLASRPAAARARPARRSSAQPRPASKRISRGFTFLTRGPSAPPRDVGERRDPDRRAREQHGADPEEKDRPARSARPRPRALRVTRRAPRLEGCLRIIGRFERDRGRRGARGHGRGRAAVGDRLRVRARRRAAAVRRDLARRGRRADDRARGRGRPADARDRAAPAAPALARHRAGAGLVAAGGAGGRRRAARARRRRAAAARHRGGARRARGQPARGACRRRAGPRPAALGAPGGRAHLGRAEHVDEHRRPAGRAPADGPRDPAVAGARHADRHLPRLRARLGARARC